MYRVRNFFVNRKIPNGMMRCVFCGWQARLRICLMVNRLLRLLGEDATIDEDLAQRIFDNMLERLKDKVAEIRAQAVTALMRLQDPRDDQCPIIRAFIFHLGVDPSLLVR